MLLVPRITFVNAWIRFGHQNMGLIFGPKVVQMIIPISDENEFIVKKMFSSSVHSYHEIDLISNPISNIGII